MLNFSSAFCFSPPKAKFSSFFFFHHPILRYTIMILDTPKAHFYVKNQTIDMSHHSYLYFYSVFLDLISIYQLEFWVIALISLKIRLRIQIHSFHIPKAMLLACKRWCFSLQKLCFCNSKPMLLKFQNIFLTKQMKNFR